uniref:DUF1365 family protein n=1 Tax=Eiseniibacteriota bacterium TaxID=2212470 RepID=A0A832MMQ5_UNCEI
MNSRLYVGHLGHARRGPVDHAFRYPVVVAALDLDELPELGRRLRLFGHNRPRPVSLWDADYLDRGPGTVREKLLARLAPRVPAGEIGRVVLVTAPRVLGHVFNPVSFHYCYRHDGALRCVVAEVNNTFGDRHAYVLDDLVPAAGGVETRRPAPKAFHVSPFYDLAGAYRFRFSDLGARLDVGIDLERDGRLAFRARLTGSARPFDDRALAAALARHPFDMLLTLPRILAQAAQLAVRRRLPVHARPEPVGPDTVRAPRPGPLERAARALVFGAFARMERGALVVAVPGEPERRFGAAGAPQAARLEVRRRRLFRRLVTHADIGLGDAYVDGDWTTPDLPGLLATLARDRDALERGPGVPPALRRLWSGGVRGHGSNTRGARGSRANIRAHYDLGNEFFRLFLDESMTYSAARWRNPDDGLAEAQAHKLALALRRARVGAGTRVLEIGSGWGSLALAAAARGAEVTGLTLSTEQCALATRRAAEAGVADRVRFELLDYRDARGTYDAIVSIEMLEAVGHRWYGAFFAALDRLLAPGGRAVVQVITIADHRYERYRRSFDWIQKRIFPGGLVPSLAALREAMAASSRLAIVELEAFGADYARTLAEWRRRLAGAAPAAAALGHGPRFLRAWEYYFAYCEAGFRTGELDVVQMVLARAGEARASGEATAFSA